MCVREREGGKEGEREMYVLCVFVCPSSSSLPKLAAEREAAAEAAGDGECMCARACVCLDSARVRACAWIASGVGGRSMSDHQANPDSQTWACVCACPTHVSTNHSAESQEGEEKEGGGGGGGPEIIPTGDSAVAGVACLWASNPRRKLACASPSCYAFSDQQKLRRIVH